MTQIVARWDGLKSESRSAEGSTEPNSELNADRNAPRSAKDSRTLVQWFNRAQRRGPVTCRGFNGLNGKLTAAETLFGASKRPDALLAGPPSLMTQAASSLSSRGGSGTSQRPSDLTELKGAPETGRKTPRSPDSGGRKAGEFN